MGIFTLPPKQPRADLDIESFLRSDSRKSPIRRMRRALATEWFPQSCIQLTWPHIDTDWASMLDEVEETYVRLAFEIATREPLLIVHPHPDELKIKLENRLPHRATDNIHYFACATDDTWSRDHAFLTVIGTGKPELLDFRFNGWGGKFEAKRDNAINYKLYEASIISGQYVDCLDFELEGGSIETDGMGTLLTTSRCLLNSNRQHMQEKSLLEAYLSEKFGVTNILWLDHGALLGDDTDSHIDTLARLCPDRKIVYTMCDDTEDEHYEELRMMKEQLQTFTDAEGNAFELIPIPLPDAIYEDEERLPATYVNYLVMNRAILMPTYAQIEKDEQARRVLQKIFPKYEVVGIDCRSLIKQHGSLHCATMQYPKGVLCIDVNQKKNESRNNSNDLHRQD